MLFGCSLPYADSSLLCVLQPGPTFVAGAESVPLFCILSVVSLLVPAVLLAVVVVSSAESPADRPLWYDLFAEFVVVVVPVSILPSSPCCLYPLLVYLC